MADHFELVSPFHPTGDQPEAIDELVRGLREGKKEQASSRLEGKTSWIFSSCGRGSRLTKSTSGTRSGGLRKGQSPCEFLGGLSEFLSR